MIVGAAAPGYNWGGLTNQLVGFYEFVLLAASLNASISHPSVRWLGHPLGWPIAHFPHAALWDVDHWNAVAEQHEGLLPRLVDAPDAAVERWAPLSFVDPPDAALFLHNKGFRGGARAQAQIDRVAAFYAALRPAAFIVDLIDRSAPKQPYGAAHARLERDVRHDRWPEMQEARVGIRDLYGMMAASEDLDACRAGAERLYVAANFALVDDDDDARLLGNGTTPWAGTALASSANGLVADAVTSRAAAALYDREFPATATPPHRAGWEMAVPAAAANLVGGVVDFYLCRNAAYFVGYPRLSTFDVAVLDARTVAGAACSFTYDREGVAPVRDLSRRYATGGAAALLPRAEAFGALDALCVLDPGFGLGEGAMYFDRALDEVQVSEAARLWMPTVYPLIRGFDGVDLEGTTRLVMGAAVEARKACLRDGAVRGDEPAAASDGNAFVEEDVVRLHAASAMTAAGGAYETDKVVEHGYERVYWRYLPPRGSAPSIFEIGVERGRSLAMWRALYPDAVLVGLDFGALMPDGFTETHWYAGADRSGRTAVLRGDGGDPWDLARARHIGPFDLVVDDGSHWPEHQMAAVAFAFGAPGFLKPGATYIVEDVETSYWRRGSKLFGNEISGATRVVEDLKGLADAVNRHVHGGPRGDWTDAVDTVTFAHNCVILTKRRAYAAGAAIPPRSPDSGAPYRFRRCIDGACDIRGSSN